MKMYERSRPPTRHCNGWHGLTHEKWRTRKLISEVKFGVEVLIEDNGQVVSKLASN